MEGRDGGREEKKDGGREEKRDRGREGGIGKKKRREG